MSLCTSLHTSDSLVTSNSPTPLSLLQLHGGRLVVAVESSHEQTEVDFTFPDFIGPERFNSGFERQGRISIASQNSCIKIY